jgi:two-component system, OmpR family, phosphate regulon sensor histidine kinase PhoR
MRSFFSQVLISNWLFLVILLITGIILYISEGYVSSDYKFILFAFYVIFSMFLAFHTSYKLASSITDKLLVIEKKTMEINAGDFGNLLSVNDTKELSDLADSINTMSKRLQMQFMDLNLEKEKFNFLLQNLKEGVFAISPERKILFQNESIPKTLIQANSQSRLIEDSIENKKLLSFLNYHIEDCIDGKLLLEFGKKFYRVRFYSLKSNSQAIMFMGVITDKTEERKIQVFREQFVQSASHELKTPITSIKGYAETLIGRLKVENDSVEKRFMEAILRNSNRMIRIVDDMLAISKMESHKSLFQPEDINLFEFIDQLKLTVEGFINLKNQVFDFEVPAELNISVDIVLFEHLLLNLIQNASNYSPENTRITLKASSEKENILIKVKDEGIGIPESHLKRIFERFYRVDTDRSRKSGGTGLGLSIVKHIVSLHSGWIDVESIEGSGSTFIIHLPVDRKVFIV